MAEPLEYKIRMTEQDVPCAAPKIELGGWQRQRVLTLGGRRFEVRTDDRGHFQGLEVDAQGLHSHSHSYLDLEQTRALVAFLQEVIT